MRELKRNKTTIRYALFVRNDPILDEDGNDTAEVKPIYTEPVELSINVSPNTGESATRQFGTTLDYDRTLVICDRSLPINENSVMWVDETDTTKPYDYVVKKVAPSLNSLQIAIKKVEVTTDA